MSIGKSLMVALAALAGAAALEAQDVVKPHEATADAYRDRTSNIDPATEALGKSVYDEVCASCHETGVNRAPQKFILAQMQPESVLRALDEGVMKPMAEGLSAEQRKAVAQVVTGRMLGSAETAKGPPRCTGAAARFDRGEPPVFSNWGLDPTGSHLIPAGVAGLGPANVGRLKLKWAVGFPNALRARSQPALAGGALFVGSHEGTVYALDRDSGCARWTFKAGAEVRTGIVITPWRAGNVNARPLAYFGDLVGNLYAVEAFSGKLAWKKRMDEHPATTLTGTPALHHGMIYVPVSSLEEGAAVDPKYPCCKFRGSLVALDAMDGRELWRSYLVNEPQPRGRTESGVDRFGPSGVPVWSSPLVDARRRQIYVTTGDNYSSPSTGLSDAIIAIDLVTGAVRWRYQALANDAWNGSCDEKVKTNCPDESGPDHDFGAAPLLAKGADGRELVISGAKSGVAYAVDPDSGELVWKQRVGRGGVVGGIHFGLAAAGGRVFVPVSDVPDGRTYDIPPQPGLYALDVATGDFVWRAPSDNVCNSRPFCHPGYSGAITATPEMVLAGANDGALRAYDSATGKLLWEADTTGEVRTVNGGTARGGSMGGGSAPIAYRGMLFMNSGYGFAGKMPGNVLLAYAAE